MKTQTTEQLRAKRCEACEGGVEKLSVKQTREQLESLPEWELTDDGERIRKHWEMRDFAAGMALLNEVARLAEEEGHHPDLHLEGYRHVRIALSTHAVGGLSENDFIMAAKIDQLPAELKD
jgi:4a-hydroxytetrahydrobiopterin dehydratase